MVGRMVLLARLSLYLKVFKTKFKMNFSPFTFAFIWFLLLAIHERGYAQLQIEAVHLNITGTSDLNSEFNFDSKVSVGSTDEYLKYGISASLSFERGYGRILVSDQAGLGLGSGQEIGSGTPTYTNSSGYTWIILLQTYTWEVRFPGNHLFITPGRDLFPGKTNVLIGFARQHPFVAGTQYGWVRMQRETADTRNAFRPDGTAKQITFMPTAFAVNPIPDQPIRAGEPPDLPQLVSEVLPPEEGLPTRVRVSWAAGWANMRLESALELGNPVQWSPVLEVTGTEAVFELPEDGQLYLRLAYVP
jgi:hypothetical protein